MKIKDITLLTKEEYEKYKNIIPSLNNDWWLNTSSSDKLMYCVDMFGEISSLDKQYPAEIRPVLKISDFPYRKNPGEKIKLFGYGTNTWTILNNPSMFGTDTIVLYDSSLSFMEFELNSFEPKITIIDLLKLWLNEDRNAFEGL